MAAEAKPAEGERPRRDYLKLAGAIVGLVAGVVGLLFTFFPNLRPSGDAPERSATVSDVRLTPNVPFRFYLARSDQSPAPFTAAQLARRGAYVEFGVSTTGYKGREVLLKWELFDKESGEQVNESRATSVRPTNATTAATWRFFIPLPERAGPLYAIVALLERKEHSTVELDSEPTPEFAGLTA